MKFFSINRSQAAVLTTLLILIFLGGGYFFIYLPQNEKRIQKQRFNALQNIDRNIHTKIENSIALLNNLLAEHQKVYKNDKDSTRLSDYIKGYSFTNFTLTTPVRTTISAQRLLKDSLNMDSAYTIQVNNNTREISLFFLKQEIKDSRKVKPDTTVYKIAMKFSFKQFIQSLLPKDVFDDYIVFSDGKPVYETFPSGISHVKKDTLLGAKNGFSGSGLRSQVIGGTDYKLFLQPVGFDSNNEWVIGGLVSNKHYQKEKTQLPTTVILLLVTIMLMGLVAFPWLKLNQMGNKDRLTVFDGITSIFISMLLLSLIFFVFFKYNYPFRPPGTKDPKIILANGINKAFKSEIDTVYHKLKLFDSLVEPGEGAIVNLLKGPMVYATKNEPVKNADQIRKIIGEANINFVFWVNKNGEEIINWTPDNINAPYGNFKAREYFKGIIEQRQYHIDEKDTSGFFLDQGISWTTGSFRSVISMESKLSFRD